MKNPIRSILFLLGISFILRFAVGIITGAADDDAGDYITYAIQTAHDNKFSNFLDLNLGRQVFQLWLFCLVCFMKVFGATNVSAILLTSIIGTANIFIFYKLMNLYNGKEASFYLSSLYSIIPVIIFTSYNPCYESIFIFSFLLSGYFYFRFFQTNQNKNLIISGLLGSSLAFIHATGYPVIFIILFSFPFIFKERGLLKKWMLFSLFLLFLPVLQMLVWKILYNSFFPYLQLRSHWLVDISGAIGIKDIIKYVIYCFFSLSFILLIGLVIFGSFINGILNRIIGIILFCSILILFMFFSLRNQNDLFKLCFAIFSLSFLILKRPLSKENALVYVFGVLGIYIFTLLITVFPQRWGPRFFAFLITLLVPVAWYYLEKVVKNEKAVFLIFSSVIGSLLIAGLIFNFTSLKNKEIGFMKGKFSSAFEYSIPFSLQHTDDRKIMNWLKKNGITPGDYVIAGIKSNRYVPANLDMAQNHFLSAFFFSYSHKEGFSKESLEDYIKWINDNNPRFIIWDIDFQDQEYAQIINFQTGERKIAFDFSDFKNAISGEYAIKDTIVNRIIVFETTK